MKAVLSLVGILFVAMLLVACSPQADTPAQEPSDDVSDLSEEIEDLGSLDEELDLGELDSLEDDLENLI